ncbi:MAG: Cupin domain protein [Methanoregula sp. PtaU1.Bin051]|nr:MAG: Cupin domain protein [Methanoregula sp. PtaU1.Bin051]
MLIRHTDDCPHRRVMDASLLCELLHPEHVSGAGKAGCSIAHAVVPAGESTLPHRLRTSTEIYYILSGTGRMRIGGEVKEVGPGHIVMIPPLAVQHIENTGTADLCFLCIVAPPWRGEDEELVW